MNDKYTDSQSVDTNIVITLGVNRPFSYFHPSHWKWTVKSTSLHCGIVYMHTANSGECCLDILCIKKNVHTIYCSTSRSSMRFRTNLWTNNVTSRTCFDLQRTFITKNVSCWEEVLLQTTEEPLFLRVSQCAHGFEAERLYKMKKHLMHCTFLTAHTHWVSMRALLRQSMSRGRWPVYYEVLHIRATSRLYNAIRLPQITGALFIFKRKAYLLGCCFFI